MSFFAVSDIVVGCSLVCFFLFKQKTAYELRISDWSSDVCSSALLLSIVLHMLEHAIVAFVDVSAIVSTGQRVVAVELAQACIGICQLLKRALQLASALGHTPLTLISGRTDDGQIGRAHV